MIQLMEVGQDEADLFALHTPTTVNHKVTPPLILQLLRQFEDLFEESMDLPPNRGIFDHKIPLIPGSTQSPSDLTGIHLNKGISLSLWFKRLLIRELCNIALALLLALWC